MPPALLRPLTAVALCLMAFTAPAQAQNQKTLTEAEKTAIEQVVRDYLMAHPEIIIEAVNALREREELAQAEAQRQALANRRDELFNNPASPVVGNPQGDVTMVEFFDYQCGYCKAVHADTKKLVESDKKLRYVYKEFPILGPASVTAARAALAANKQGKYVEMHNALMENRGQLDDEKIMRIAGSVGLDVERLKKDMGAPDIQESLDRNLRLAQELNIRGTPAFVVGDQIVPGAIDLERMKQLVASQRNG